MNKYTNILRIVGICAGTLILGGIGYTAWGALSANAQNDAWAKHLDGISEVGNVTPDRTAVTFASAPLATCTQTEVTVVYVRILARFAEQFGDAGASFAVPAATAEAPKTCAAEKRAAFTRSVAEAQLDLVAFLKVIGAPDSIAASTDGLRGLDGTQTQTFHGSNVGNVTIQSRYDGGNGLSVTLIREPATVDWGVLVRALNG